MTEPLYLLALFPVRIETPRNSHIIVSIVTLILFNEINYILFIDFSLLVCGFL